LDGHQNFHLFSPPPSLKGFFGALALHHGATVGVGFRFVEGNATGLFQATGEAGLEGIVIKRKDAPYRPGIRSGSWQKVIHWKKAEVVITGYRKDKPGWLIAIEEDGQPYRR